jgi:hypothetical protein
VKVYNIRASSRYSGDVTKQQIPDGGFNVKVSRHQTENNDL